MGAGQGTRTRALSKLSRRWIAIEPDAGMSEALSRNVARDFEVFQGTLQDLPPDLLADTILYIDVLEHIERDVDELAAAAARLRHGGHLVVLSPAHSWLYTEFDRAIGHHRRYSLRALRAAAPPGLIPRRARMLDSVGMLASAANRFLLRSAMPTLSQVLFWDRAMVPVSTLLDRVLFYRAGKSVLLVWEKPAR